MDADEIKAMYRSMCLQTVTIRRYSGLGAARTPADYAAAGNATLYDAKDLVGSVRQGDVRVIAIADDLVAAGLTLPVTTNDRVVVDGREMAAFAVATRKALEGDLIAYEITARG